MEAAIHHSPDLGYGTIVPIRTVRDVRLTVAPGEPDDPQRARRFVLSWWEKDPPKEAGGIMTKRVNSWYFITKTIGVKGREVAAAGQSAALWVAMFGVPYAVRLAEEGDHAG